MSPKFRTACAGVIAVVMVLALPVATLAHVPADSACYYGSTTSHTANLYMPDGEGGSYSKTTSRVDYQVGYNCVGQAILTKVTYRKLTFTGYQADGRTHKITAYDIGYQSNCVPTCNHTSTNNIYHPNVSCIGACTVSASTGADVLLEYSSTNTAYIYVTNSNLFAQPWAFYHCVLPNTIDTTWC